MQFSPFGRLVRALEILLACFPLEVIRVRFGNLRGLLLFGELGE
jgi:hypothetical protein